MTKQISREKITLVMARNQMSIVDLAVAYGCSYSRMCVLLNSRTCTTKTAGKIANALNIDVTDIFE